MILDSVRKAQNGVGKMWLCSSRFCSGFVRGLKVEKEIGELGGLAADDI